MSSINEAARDVVERVRAGDQVAMGILAMVRDNAKAGNKRAQKSIRAIQKYIDSHPDATMGYENGGTNQPAALLWSQPTAENIALSVPLAGFWPSIVALVHGPLINQQRVEEINATLPDSEQAPFQAACNNQKPVQARGWLIGRVLLIARRIQNLRNPNVPLASFCPVVAWELGE